MYLQRVFFFILLARSVALHCWTDAVKIYFHFAWLNFGERLKDSEVFGVLYWTFSISIANIANSLKGDLLFFNLTPTSPMNQPPSSSAAMRNGWYFWGELAFPFLASIFISTTSESKRQEREGGQAGCNGWLTICCRSFRPTGNFPFNYYLLWHF